MHSQCCVNVLNSTLCAILYGVFYLTHRFCSDRTHTGFMCRCWVKSCRSSAVRRSLVMQVLIIRLKCSAVLQRLRKPGCICLGRLGQTRFWLVPILRIISTESPSVNRYDVYWFHTGGKWIWNKYVDSYERQLGHLQCWLNDSEVYWVVSHWVNGRWQNCKKQTLIIDYCGMHTCHRHRLRLLLPQNHIPF